MALAYVPRSSTPAALISLVSELSSSSENEVEQEEPIVSIFPSDEINHE
jgi:hypothetical protein